MKVIKKLVIFFLFGIMLTFSVRAPLQPFVVKKSNNISAECKCHFFFNRSRQKEGTLFKQRARSMISPFYIAKKRV